MKVALVLLAAGQGRRFGENKLLYLYKGRPLYRWAADELDLVPEGVFSQRIVVTPYREIAADLSVRGYRVVENREGALGISHSIRLGINEVEDCRAACCFCVCDQPNLKGGTIEKFIKSWKESKRGLGCLCFGGELGNPAVFSAKYRKELLSLEGDTGGKRIIRKHPDDLFLFETEAAELMDIDTRDEVL